MKYINEQIIHEARACLGGCNMQAARVCFAAILRHGYIYV
jgi:hypothetical protein